MGMVSSAAPRESTGHPDMVADKRSDNWGTPKAGPIKTKINSGASGLRVRAWYIAGNVLRLLDVRRYSIVRTV